jgi:choline dehydrogenase-like flavoprotein
MWSAVGSSGSWTHPARGNLLAGSSASNVMAYIRPSATDIDSWMIENKGWSWDELEPYYQKSETYHLEKKSYEMPFSMDPKFHEQTGPIQLSFPPTPVPFEDSLTSAFDEMSNPLHPKDLFNGTTWGVLRLCQLLIGELDVRTIPPPKPMDANQCRQTYSSSRSQ